MALRDDEKPRLQADLGGANFLMLRNHGLLTVGRTVPDAFLDMYLFENTCRIQIDAQAGGELVQVNPAILQGMAEVHDRRRPPAWRRSWPGRRCCASSSAWTQATGPEPPARARSQAARVSSAIICSRRSKSGISGYSFTIRTWQMTGTALAEGARVVRVQHVRAQAHELRKALGQDREVAVRNPAGDGLHDDDAGAPAGARRMRPQAASNEMSGTRRPPHAIVPRYHGGAPSIGVGAW